MRWSTKPLTWLPTRSKFKLVYRIAGNFGGGGGKIFVVFVVEHWTTNINHELTKYIAEPRIL